MFLPTYQISEPTLLPTYRDSFGLQADAQVVMVFSRHIDNFIVTWQILPTYRDNAIWTVSSWHQTFVHLSGLCKNTCQPWHGNSLNRRAVSTYIWICET